MARRTKEEAEQTREEIMRAGLDLFCEKGYSKTTFDEIAQRIDRTKGAVYWHFRNKPDLLIALIKEVIIRSNDYVSRKLPEIKTINDLKEYFLYNAETLQKNQLSRKFMFFALYQMEWSESLYNKVKISLEDILDIPLKKMKETLTLLKKSGEIASNIDTNQISEIFFCFWKGAVNAELTDTRPDFIPFIGKGFDIIIGSIKEERL